ncbi:hypothetical protein ACFTAO_31665 [Paenibacillus rhizoplanae]
MKDCGESWRTEKNLTIITNSLAVLSEFQHSGQKLISTGGLLGPETSSFVGPTASQTILKYNVDVAIFQLQGTLHDRRTL